jgi:hypothetical protein
MGFAVAINRRKSGAGARSLSRVLRGKLEKLWYLVVEECNLPSMIRILGQLDSCTIRVVNGEKEYDWRNQGSIRNLQRNCR